MPRRDTHDESGHRIDLELDGNGCTATQLGIEMTVGMLQQRMVNAWTGIAHVVRLADGRVCSGALRPKLRRTGVSGSGIAIAEIDIVGVFHRGITCQITTHPTLFV